MTDHVARLAALLHERQCAHGETVHGRPHVWDVADAEWLLAHGVRLAEAGPQEPRPRIVCLCGSTRFMETFFEQQWRLTLEGCIVLSVGVVKTEQADEHGGHAAELLGEDVKERLDTLHLRKIDLADEVLVLNVGGYIGESTRREIEYARQIGKPVSFLEPAIAPNTSVSVQPGASSADPAAEIAALRKEAERIAMQTFPSQGGEDLPTWRYRQLDALYGVTLRALALAERKQT